MTNKIAKPKNGRKHRKCQLEVIAEEEELDIDCLVENKFRTDEVKELRNNFTPFQSSWKTSSQNASRMYESTVKASENVLDKQLKSLTRNYYMISEEKRLLDLEKKSMASYIDQLVEESQKLKQHLAEKTKEIDLERVNAEQTKIDYEFMLERQNKTFKTREAELLETIEKLTHTPIFEQNDSPCILNTFEYEEISEKLKSFEKQNDLLQKSRNKSEKENKELKNELYKLQKSYAALKLQYHKLKYRPPKWLNLQLSLNNTNIIRDVEEIENNNKNNLITMFKQQNCMNDSLLKIKEQENENTSYSRKKLFVEFEKLIEKKFSSNEFLEDVKVKKIFQQITLEHNISNETCDEANQLTNPKEIITKVENHCLEKKGKLFFELLKIYLKKIQANYENRNQKEFPNQQEEVKNSTLNSEVKLFDRENTKKGFDEYNTMNLSDSEKLNEVIFKDFSNPEYISKNYNISKQFPEIENIPENNSILYLEQNKIGKIVERHHKDEDLLQLIREYEEKIESLTQYTKSLKTEVDNKRLYFEILSKLLLDNEGKSENELSSLRLNNPNIMVNKSLQCIFIEKIIKMKSIINNSRNENEQLKEIILKIYTYIQELKTDYVKFKKDCLDQMFQHTENVKIDILKSQEVCLENLLTELKALGKKKGLLNLLKEKAPLKENSTKKKEIEKSFDKVLNIGDEWFINTTNSKNIRGKKGLQTINEEQKNVLDEDESMLTGEIAELETTRMFRSSEADQKLNGENLQDSGRNLNSTILQNNYERKNNNFSVKSESRKHKWKIIRTREHDNRRKLI